MLGPVFLCAATADDSDLSQLAARLQEALALESNRRDLRVYTSLKGLAPDEAGDEAMRTAVEVGAVMVPVVTPELLLAPWSRQEVLAFDRTCRAEGLVGLIVPVLWEPTAALERPEDDDVAMLLKGRQYVDFSELRFESWSHPGKGRALVNLARTVIAALKRGARSDSLISVPPATPYLGRKPKVRPSPGAERDLAALLSRMYTATELRMLPGRLPQGHRFDSLVPAGISSAGQAAMDLVRALSRLDAIDADFFAQLRRERPFRKTEIDGVARKFVL